MKLLFIIAIVSSALSLSCHEVTVNSQTVAANSTPNAIDLKKVPSSKPTDTDDDSFFPKFYSKKASLTYKGYTVRKILVKKREDKDSPVADIYDAVLEKNGKTIFRFKGSYYPLGNEIGFGLYGFLNNGEKQLIVSDISYKWGASWIVDLSDRPRIIFDSSNYDGFREFIDIEDLDGDGTSEISMSAYRSCGFDGLATTETPFLSFTFAYDSKLRKFVPANYRFPDKVKSGIAQKISTYQQRGKELDFRNIIEIFLEYSYGGMDEEAWKFFDEKYLKYQNGIAKMRSENANYGGAYGGTSANPVSATEDARMQLKQCLAKDPIYQSIQRNK